MQNAQQIASLDAYIECFDQVAFWEPTIRFICNKHFENEVLVQIETCSALGTYPTFVLHLARGNALVIKLYHSGFFKGYKAFCKELNLFNLWQQQATIQPYMPEFFGCGDEAPNIYYLFTEYITLPHVTVVTVPFLHALATFVSHLHAIPLANAQEQLALCNGFAKRLAKQQQNSTQFHKAAQVFPHDLILQMPDYLQHFYSQKYQQAVLLHGDLHKDHTFYEESTNQLKVIDFGDATIASPFVELITLHLGLFEGDKTLLKQFLDLYQWTSKTNIEPQSSEFAYACTCFSLLHEFNVYGPFESEIGQFTTLKQVEERFWKL